MRPIARFRTALLGVVAGSQVVHGQSVPFGYVALTSAYGVLYIAALLVPAVVIFSRRDFK